MTPDERRQLLGADTVADIHARVAIAPPLEDEDVIAELRRILTRPARRTTVTAPVPHAA